MKALIVAFLVGFLPGTSENVTGTTAPVKQEIPTACPAWTDLFTLIAHTASGICTFKYIGPNATGSVNGTPVTFTNGSMWNWTSSDIVCVTINPPNLPCCYQVPC